jgi:hypothetical protein
MKAIVLLASTLAAFPVCAAQPTVLQNANYSISLPIVGNPAKLARNKWLALVWAKNGWRLVPTSLTARYDKNDDDVKLSSPAKEAHYFIRVSGLKPGPVSIVGGGLFFTKPVGRRIEDPCDMPDGKCKSYYKIGSRKYEVEFIEIGASRHVPPSEGKLVLRQLLPIRTEQEVLVVRGPWFSQWTVDAAGDFDSDGKLDILFRGDDTAEPDSRLFLSTLAKPNELVRVAESPAAR